MPDVGATISKDPDAELVYAVDWGRYLPDETEIASSTWLITEGDETPPTQSSAAIDGTRTRVRIEGGTAGQTYRITNRITFGSSPVQKDDRSFFLRIRER